MGGADVSCVAVCSADGDGALEHHSGGPFSGNLYVSALTYCHTLICLLLSRCATNGILLTTADISYEVASRLDVHGYCRWHLERMLAALARQCLRCWAP